MRKQPNPGLLCVLAVLALLLLSCSKEGSSRNIVARVDGREITADEFAFAYELSPRQITSQAPATAR
ncbi:MAG: hypothetical protein ABIA75_08415, partial [Candidatus Neomarinimicrobiota bacterium]